MFENKRDLGNGRVEIDGKQYSTKEIPETLFNHKTTKYIPINHPGDVLMEESRPDPMPFSDRTLYRENGGDWVSEREDGWNSLRSGSEAKTYHRDDGTTRRVTNNPVWGRPHEDRTYNGSSSNSSASGTSSSSYSGSGYSSGSSRSRSGGTTRSSSSGSSEMTLAELGGIIFLVFAVSIAAAIAYIVYTILVHLTNWWEYYLISITAIAVIWCLIRLCKKSIKDTRNWAKKRESWIKENQSRLHRIATKIRETAPPEVFSLKLGFETPVKASTLDELIDLNLPTEGGFGRTIDAIEQMLHTPIFLGYTKEKLKKRPGVNIFRKQAVILKKLFAKIDNNSIRHWIILRYINLLYLRNESINSYFKDMLELYQFDHSDRPDIEWFVTKEARYFRPISKKKEFQALTLALLITLVLVSLVIALGVFVLLP